MSGTASNNNVFIADVESLPGSEPPRHVHTHEDEIIVVKEGTITYFVGDRIIQAAVGDIVVLPKNIPHHFVITSEKMKIVLITTPGNFGAFFNRLSVPYNGFDIPVVQRPSEQRKKEISALMEEFGIYHR
jgi:hypothetical protein